MTPIAVSQVVRRVRPLVSAAEAPDFFVMIDQQARMVVNLARVLAEVLQGKESAHSLRLLEMEQRREELQRRNQAVVDSLPQAGMGEMHSTMDALDRAAVLLIRAARDCHPGWSAPDAAAFQMLAVIQKAIESLQNGYARLANGSPAAEYDADAAIVSQSALASGKTLVRGVPATEERFLAPSQGMSPAHACWPYGLHENLNKIAHELSGAGVILKSWSRQLSAGSRGFALFPQQFVAS
ncbi:MAG: hypothetical protein ABTS16_07035 [Candidatus Accumulibacter phosphatis]|jgi:type II secretory pathway component PulJ|uniref:Uncharacterized protein n=2 Tax=Candidatus Accumulibacter TaxID=327159 RepID=A0A080LZB2_9PROT|nr:hypothetical protein [Candidatus Accumulibacter contiguus]KFB74228.1 MAG: hypothetical protein AW09_000496 [Candidatus Accumulibacter phosphatis]MBL8407441.1 hypothetical protein [Accumulibacter sp.]NMQ05650.1 hypothetical protein [Candidatus Accumulibacter contiguus]